MTLVRKLVVKAKASANLKARRERASVRQLARVLCDELTNNRKLILDVFQAKLDSFAESPVDSGEMQKCITDLDAQVAKIMT